MSRRHKDGYERFDVQADAAIAPKDPKLQAMGRVGGAWAALSRELERNWRGAYQPGVDPRPQWLQRDPEAVRRAFRGGGAIRDPERPKASQRAANRV